MKNPKPVSTLKYGLREKKTGKLVGLNARANSEDCDGVSVTYTLSKYADGGAWLVDEPEHAEYVRQNSTEWYNAGVDTPENDFEPNELEVVRVKQEVNLVKVKIPTVAQYFKLRYLRKDLKYYNPAHYEACIKDLLKRGIKYSLYELKELQSEMRKEIHE